MEKERKTDNCRREEGVVVELGMGAISGPNIRKGRWPHRDTRSPQERCQCNEKVGEGVLAVKRTPCEMWAPLSVLNKEEVQSAAVPRCAYYGHWPSSAIAKRGEEEDYSLFVTSR